MVRVNGCVTARAYDVSSVSQTMLQAYSGTHIGLCYKGRICIRVLGGDDLT